MKLGHNKYYCEWCSTTFSKQRNSVPAANNPGTGLPGRHTVTATMSCPKCGRDVSQRTKEGFR